MASSTITPTRSPTQSSSVGLPTIQMQALQSFWGSMNSFSGNTPSWKSGPNQCPPGFWWNFASQTASTDACSIWCGVTCDGNIPPNVKSLSLADLNLQGSIPSNIANLQGLQSLKLNKNLITKTIPDSIHALSNLVEINLSDNQLTGTLPAQIGSLSKLQVLKIMNTGVHGQIPQSYCNLVSGGGCLQALYLTGNGALTCYPSCLVHTSSSTVLFHDENLGECSAPGGGGSSVKTLTISSANDDEKTITIAAGIAGGLVGLLCIIGIVYALMRSKKSKSKNDNQVVVIQSQTTKAESSRDEEVGNPLIKQSKPPARMSMKPLPINAKLASPAPAPAPSVSPYPQAQPPPQFTGVPPSAQTSSSNSPQKRFTLQQNLQAPAPPMASHTRHQGESSLPNHEEEGGEGSSEDDHGGSDWGSDEGSENKVERGQEQRFELGTNPMAGRRVTQHKPMMEGGQSSGANINMPRAPVPWAPRGPPIEPQRRTSTAPSNMAIRPEMQEAAMAKKFTFMNSSARPPPPPGGPRRN